MIPFHSSLGARMSDFVTFKRLQGYDYTKRGLRLADFDRFLCQNSYTEGILIKSITDKYIDENAHLQSASRLEKLSPVRVFSKYLHMFEPTSYIIGPTPFPVQRKIRFYLYSRDDICELMVAAGKLTRADIAIPFCLPVLFGLLYATGLRIFEALKLAVGDIDFDKDILSVKNGKYGKDRYIALHNDVSRQLKKWLKKRDEIIADKSAEFLFVDSQGSYLKYGRVRKHFHNLIIKCAIGKNNPFVPRIHDLRHTFACNVVNTWRMNREDVNAKLPILSTAMGHVDIYATQKYLHVTSAGLHEAAEHFHEKVFNHQGDR